MAINFRTFLENFYESEIFINTPRGKETYSVAKLAVYAQRNLRRQEVSIDWLRRNINGSGKSALHEPPQEGEDHDRSARSDLNYPILIIREPGEVWVGDGNHRIYKALHITRQPTLPAYIIDSESLPPPNSL